MFLYKYRLYNKPNKCTKGTTVSGRKDEKTHLTQLFLTKCLFVLL